MAVSNIDHCTFWPDKLFGVDYSQCCYAHDVAYAMQLPKLTADFELGLCVAQSGLPALGALMAVGTAIFGGRFYRRK